jgi:cellulose synthase operon protein C
MNTIYPTRGHAAWLAIAVTLALAACGARLTADERVDLAREHLSQGDAATAVIQLKNALQHDPVNVEARILLAEASLRSGDIETAVKEYSRALDLGADIDAFRVPYAEALVRGGDGAGALQVTEPDEAGESAELAYWRGLALLRTGRTEEAQAMLEGVADDPAMRVRARIGLARVALVSERPAEAIAQLEPLASEAARDSDYWEVMAFASMQAGRHEAAVEAFAKAAETVVDAVGNQRIVFRSGEVEALLAAGRLEDARRKAEQLLERAPQSPIGNYLMARIELQAGNPRQALAHAQAVLAAQPNSSHGYMMAGAAHLMLGQTGQAERQLERAVASEPGNIQARRLLAQTRLGMQAPDRALEVLEPLLEGADHDATRLAGVASIRAGDPEAAVELFRRQLELDPDNDELRSMLAVSLMSAGRIDEALAELGRVTSTDVAIRQRAALIQTAAHLRAGDSTKARETAMALAAAHPADAALHSALGGMFLSHNEPDDAVAWFEAGLRIEPGNRAAQFNLGRIAAAMGRPDEARERFRAIVDADPANAAARAALAQVEWATGDREAALAQLEQARRASRTDAHSRIMLASYFLALDRAADALSVAREAVEIQPRSAPAVNTLGLAQLGTGDARSALAQFDLAHEIAPTMSGYLVNKARAEVAVGQGDAARRTLINALALDPENQRALFALVDVERRLGRLDAAAQTLARLERVADVSTAGVELMRGELLLARGDSEAAERAFSGALEGGIGGRAAVGIFEARRRGSTGDPAEPLLGWLAEQPDDRLVRSILADHYLAQEDHAAAIREYEHLLEAAPGEVVLLNNLAWLYDQVGDARALQFAERAHRQAPNDPMVADTLGWILYKQGDTARALELVGQAARAAPGVGEIQYRHAVLLAETGDTAAAVRAARAVLAETGAANYHEAAQKLLDRLEKGKDR